MEESKIRRLESLIQRFGLSKKIEEGLQFKVSRYGDNLSDGEKQILSFIRAVHLNKKIIILDEITAKIDEISENLMEDIIKTELKESTLIIISHKISTLRICDKIVIIQNGNIIGEGNPKDLM